MLTNNYSDVDITCKLTMIDMIALLILANENNEENERNAE